MKKLHKFNENWMDDPSSINYRRNLKLNKDDRTDILGKGRRAFDDDDSKSFYKHDRLVEPLDDENDLPDPAGFDLDLKTDELDNNMENLVSKFGIGKVKNWIENYLR